MSRSGFSDHSRSTQSPLRVSWPPAKLFGANGGTRLIVTGTTFVSPAMLRSSNGCALIEDVPSSTEVGSPPAPMSQVVVQLVLPPVASPLETPSLVFQWTA